MIHHCDEGIKTSRLMLLVTRTPSSVVSHFANGALPRPCPIALSIHIEGCTQLQVSITTFPLTLFSFSELHRHFWREIHAVAIKSTSQVDMNLTRQL